MFLHKRCDYVVINEMEFRFLALLAEIDPDRYSTELIDAEWPVYLGILKTESALIEAAEAFFATYTVDVEGHATNTAAAGPARLDPAGQVSRVLLEPNVRIATSIRYPSLPVE